MAAAATVALQTVVPAAAALTGVALTQWGQRRANRDSRFWERRADLYVDLLRLAYDIEYFYEFELETAETYGSAANTATFNEIWAGAVRLRHTAEAFASDAVHGAYSKLALALTASDRAIEEGRQLHLADVEPPIRILRESIHRDLDPARRRGLFAGLRIDRPPSSRLLAFGGFRAKRRVRDVQRRLEAELLVSGSEIRSAPPSGQPTDAKDNTALVGSSN